MGKVDLSSFRYSIELYEQLYEVKLEVPFAGCCERSNERKSGVAITVLLEQFIIYGRIIRHAISGIQQFIRSIFYSKYLE